MWRRVLVGIAAFSSVPPSPRDCLDICSISVRLGVDVARHASPIFLHPSLDHVAPVFDTFRTADGPLGWEKWGAAERPPRKPTWHIPFGVSELGGDVVGCAVLRPVSASPDVWRWSSSPRITYEYYYITDLYRPLRKWTIPTIDRDTDPYPPNLPIYEQYGHTAWHERRFTLPDSGDDSIAKEPRKYQDYVFVMRPLWTTNKLMFSQPQCYGLSWLRLFRTRRPRRQAWSWGMMKRGLAARRDFCVGTCWPYTIE